MCPAHGRPKKSHWLTAGAGAAYSAIRLDSSHRFNNNGCSLIYGHPQAPMGLRGIMELIEELADNGGGFGLFAGCAAGDTAMALVIEARDA